MDQSTDATLHYLSGYIDKIIYENLSNPHSLFSVFSVVITSKNFFYESDRITVQIKSAPPEEGELEYQFYGKLMDLLKYGPTLIADVYIRCLPISNEGAVEYLGSGLFKGIGKKKAKQIVDTLGDDCLIKIINNPKILLEVKGIGEKYIDTIQESLVENLGLYKLIPKLFDWNISLFFVKEIYKQFGDSSIKKIEENPYCLANNIRGIGFKKADEIAMSLNIGLKDMKRIKGAMEFVLHDIYDKEGSTFAYEKYLIKKVQILLKEQDNITYPKEFLKEALTQLAGENPHDNDEFTSDIGELKTFGERIYLKKYYLQEILIAQSLLAYHYDSFQSLLYFTEDFFKRNIIKVEEYLDKQLTLEQQEAIIKAMRSRISIITGGPGTGKTTIVNGLVMMYVFLQSMSSGEEFLNRIIILAPTGRAAKRLYESTQIPAQTIHSFLMTLDIEHNKSEYERLIIIDEVSMVDIGLMERLLSRLPGKDRVVLIGDERQLPSIKAGNLLRDILNSNILDITRLTKPFRQSQDSNIIKLAYNIRNEEDKAINIKVETEDTCYIEADSSSIISELIKILKVLTEQGNHLLKNIQIIVPIQRSNEGIINVNKAIQNALLQGEIIDSQHKLIETPFENSTYAFCIGDKVIQGKNDPEKYIFNGDIGIVTGVVEENDLNIPNEETPPKLIVKFEEVEVTYTQEELEDLALSYCFSVHKSQGSEFPIVIVPFSPSYKRMLTRELIYTAITRAKDYLIMIGNDKLFYEGLKQKLYIRHTSLDEILIEEDKKRLETLV